MSYNRRQIISGTIDTLAYGGKGILRSEDGLVVFVSFTAPQDEIECKLTKMKKNYAEGELLKLIKKSPFRQAPKCPYFGTCGGCQLQHIAYPEQARHKQTVIQKALERVYPNASAALFPATAIWEYRTHITMTLKPKEQSYSAGFYAFDNKTLVKAESCSIFSGEKDPILKILHLISSELIPAGRDLGKVKILKNGSLYLLSFHFKNLPKNFSKIGEKYLNFPISGISGSSMHKNVFFGKEEIEFQIEGKKIATSPAAFLQAHPEQSKDIYLLIASLLKEKPANFLIDLYSGIGISSIFASPYANRIEGIEMNKKGVDFARQNAKSFAHLHFQAAKVEDALPKLLEQNPDFAIANPPREGIEKQVAEKLAKSSIKRMIYISCQPATLARDLEIFKNEGFVLKKAQGFDMFPQTAHIETLVYLTR